MPAVLPHELAMVYQAICALGTATRRQVAQHLGSDRLPDVGKALEQLVNYGLVERSTSIRGGYWAVDPLEGIGQAHDQALARFAAEVETLNLVAREGWRGRQISSVHAPADSELGVTRIVGRDARLRETARLTSEAKQSIDSLLSETPSESTFSYALEHDRPTLERGVVMRSIYPEAARHSLGALEYVNSVRPYKVEFRTSLSTPVRLGIYDNVAAIISSTTNNAAGVALVIRESTLVSALSDYFSMAWHNSRVIGRGDSEFSIDTTERAILDGLLRGKNDREIAESLSRSEKTVGRRIVEMQKEVGASSRFALGVEAEKRGWLDAS